MKSSPSGNFFQFLKGVCPQWKSLYQRWLARIIDTICYDDHLTLVFLFVSIKEVTEEIKRMTVNGFSVTCNFAWNERATLRNIRKKADRKLMGNLKAYKIPYHLLNPSFVEHIRHGKSLPSLHINNSKRPTIRLHSSVSSRS